MSGRLEGRIAIVTGAAGGIGSAIVRKMVAEGACVVAVDQTDQALASTHPDDRQIMCLACDITDATAPETVVTAAIDSFGGLDTIVNNAGIFHIEPADSTDETLWSRMLDTNVTAMFRFCRASLPPLRESRRGRIINISSISAIRATSGVAAYAASKAAVGGLTRALATECGEDLITANYILPGSILTDMIRPRLEDPAARDRLEGFSPLGRLGQPEDIANAVAFLASDEASFISGHGLAVDGGFLAKA